MVSTGTDPEYSEEDNTILKKTQLTNSTQIANTAESLQATMNSFLMGGSSITSNKPLMLLTGTYPENSEENYLNSAARKCFFKPF